MANVEKEAKGKASDAEAIAEWLGRETGHTPEADEGYGDQPVLDMPTKRRADLGQFFDGLHVQKEMQARRRDEAVTALDEADELRKAIAPTLNQGAPQ